jgi:hypothetical protein
MTWVTIWLVVYLIELLIWANVIYLHYEIKINQQVAKFPKKMSVIVKSKKDIVRG